MMFKDLTTSTKIRDIHMTMEPQWDEVTLSIQTSYYTSRDKIKPLNSSWISSTSIKHLFIYNTRNT